MDLDTTGLNRNEAGRAADERRSVVADALKEYDGDATVAIEPKDEPSEPEPEGDAPTDQDTRAEPEDVSGDAPTADSEGQQAEEPADDHTAQVDAPKHWPQERRDAFHSNDPETLRNIILEREKEVNKGFEEKAKEAKEHRNFVESTRQYITSEDRQLMQSMGWDEPTAIGYLFQAHRNIMQDPQGAVAQMAQNSGDPQTFVHGVLQRLQISPEAYQQSGKGQGDQAQNADGSAEEDEFADDPYFQQLQAKLNGKVESLEQRIEHLTHENNRLRQTYEGDVRQRQEQTVQSFQQTVDAFKSEADDNGNPKFPHYDQLEDRMAFLVTKDPHFRARQFSSERDMLEAAYNEAMYHVPELRQEAINRERERAAEEARKEQQNQQRKRAKTITGGPGASGQTTPGKMDLSQAVSAALADTEYARR